jgi:hypothetical protein
MMHAFWRLTEAGPDTYTDSLASFEGDVFAGVLIRSSDIDRRVLNVAIPKGAMSAAQQAAIQAAAFRGRAFGVDLVLTPF